MQRVDSPERSQKHELEACDSSSNGAVGFIVWLDAAIRTTGAAVASGEDAESGGVSELL